MASPRIKIPRQPYPQMPISEVHLKNLFFRHGEWDPHAQQEGGAKGGLKFNSAEVLKLKAHRIADEIEERIHSKVEKRPRLFVLSFLRGHEARDDESMRVVRDVLKERLKEYAQPTVKGDHSELPVVFIRGYHPLAELRGVPLMKVRDELVRIGEMYRELAQTPGGKSLKELYAMGVSRKEARRRAVQYAQFEDLTESQMRDLRAQGVYKDEFWYREADHFTPGLGPHDMARYLGNLVKDGIELTRRSVERRPITPDGAVVHAYALNFAHTSLGALPWSLRGRKSIPDLSPAEHFTVHTRLQNKGAGVIEPVDETLLDFNGKMTAHSRSEMFLGGVPVDRPVGTLPSAKPRTPGARRKTRLME